MKQKLLIRDLTLRDGQQSSFATRMNQSQIDRVLPYYKDAAFYAMEVWGGAVPDAVMRYLGENPWDRLKKISEAIGDSSKLAALSRGRNLFGYAPYPDEIIDGFFKKAVECGLDIMRIFDALNDVDNIKSSVKSIKKYGGMADCAVCYTIDPKSDDEAEPKKKKGIFGIFGKKKKEEALKHKKVFTDEYFVNKAKEMAALGADIITIKDMSGLITPSRVASLVPLFKQQLDVPVDFHTHCTPGYGLASVLTAIMKGVDIVDTNIWYFAGGPAAPAIELVYIFCKKLGIDIDVNMEAVARINNELYEIRKELAAYDTVKQFPKKFNPLTDALPANIDKEFDNAIEAVEKNDENALLDACHAIEAYFGFPKPNEQVKNAEIPGGMYTNMVAQLKELNEMDILDDALKLIPSVRLDAGLPPLVTPTSQIIGVQAVSSAINLKHGRPKYQNSSNQFIALVKGEYGKTPVPIDPNFRKQITGSAEEVPYDTSNYKRQDNPVLPEFGNVRLAKDEKEQLLLELFPMVAATFLQELRKKEYLDAHPEKIAGKEEVSEEALQSQSEENTKRGNIMASPMPGNILEVLVNEGDEVKRGDALVILESMKMENEIPSEFSGKVVRVYVKKGENVGAEQPLVEIV
ncbi:MAG: biotin/lipoyl-binding protein [Bacteroidales bacterium]|nr:biotin/lipoyl-binding protein [Bacteroidales bacterium]